MDVLGQEEVVEQTDLETGEQPVAASEQPATAGEPTGDAGDGAAPTEKPAGIVTLDPEAQLAAEALAATEEIDPEKKDTVPVAVVAGLRAKVRERDQLLDVVRQELANYKKPPEPVVELSPLEKWIEENPEDAEVSSPPATVQLAERKWQEGQAHRRVQEESIETRKQLGNESLAKARADFSDFDEIYDLGSKYLTVGNGVDITNSKQPGQLIYKLCIKQTLEEGSPEDKAALRQHLQAKLAKAQKSVPVVRVNNKQKQTPVAPVPSAPTRNPRLAQVLATFDI